MTKDPAFDLTLGVNPCEPVEFSAEDRREIAAWFNAHLDKCPGSVRRFIAIHQKYLNAGADLRSRLNAAVQELRRAMRITASSERCRSGAPLAAAPRQKRELPLSPREQLQESVDRCHRLEDWHEGLSHRHHAKAKRIEEKLAAMPHDNMTAEDIAKIPVEEFALTEEELAQSRSRADEFVAHLLTGAGVDESLKSVNETLMPSGAVLANQELVHLEAVIPDDLADAQVVKTLHEPRVRYDFSVAVTRIELDVEKKVVVDGDGDRHVISASTGAYGPAGFSVTWTALATLTVMVGQFALPLHRLATMLSGAGKRFTAATLSKLLHAVATRLLPVYLELATQLANSNVLAGDDTSSRVVEVSKYLAKAKEDPAWTRSHPPPWADYRTPEVSADSLRRCERAACARIRRRADGDRGAKRTAEEIPSLGALIGKHLTFESPRRSGDGPKQELHTTVVSGRSVAADPRSLIVFYRSHLGSYGNLLEELLAHRSPKLREVILQGDLSTTNLVTAPELCKRFNIKTIGCSAHARRPFALHEQEDPVRCEFMLHLFLGLAIHERQLDELGRNCDNVLAVRQNDSRRVWNEILALAKKMAAAWSPATKLGVAARYIIRHFDKLTVYLDDPRLEPTNNLRERMLRLEKLIEGASAFRRTVEGRFVLDVVRTVLQTAVAAGVPVHAYLVWLLRASERGEVANDPSRFTPAAYAAAHSSKSTMTDQQAC